MVSPAFYRKFHLLINGLDPQTGINAHVNNAPHTSNGFELQVCEI